MKKKLFVNIIREIWKSRSRFLSIFLIVALGTGFYAGLKASGPDMINTVENYYHDFYDLRLYTETGFSVDDINDLLNNEVVLDAFGRYEVDFVYDDNQNVLRIISSKDYKQYHLVSGRYPQSDHEILVSHDAYKIGERITIDESHILNHDFVVVGTVMSPEFITHNYGKTHLGDGEIDFYVVMYEDNFLLSRYTNVLVKVENKYRAYDEKYFDVIDEAKLKLMHEGIQIYDRRNIDGYINFRLDVDKVEQIANVIPIFFILIAILITLTTMTRMVSEQRLEIGTLSALGYKKMEIASKYFIYAFIVTLFGTLIGVSCGILILPRIVYNAYNMTYLLPSLDFQPHWDYLLICLLTASLSTTFSAFIACINILKTVPSQLLRGKSPISGKKILLERIKFFWNRLSFNMKMTVRNIFRYKRRSLITIIGICGCAGLMLTGFGLRNAIIKVSDKQFFEIFQYDAYALITPNANIDFSKYPEIDDSLFIYQNTYQVKGEDSLFIDIIVPENVSDLDKFICLQNRETQKKLTLDDEGVIITERVAKINNLKVNDYITIIDYSNQEINLKVMGITENYLKNYLYISKDLFIQKFHDFDYNIVLLQLNNQNVTELLKQEPNILATSLISSNEEYFSESTNNLAFIVLIIILSSGLLAFIVLYNLANINITERIKELATFKVLGMNDLEVSNYIARENYFCTIIGIGFGLLIGYYFESYVIDIIESNEFMLIQNIDIFSYIYTVILTIVFSICVNIILHFRIKKIDMVTALKSYE
ncbi:MAG TPA: ABC transporter permease [Bacilli bacterium]